MGWYSMLFPPEPQPIEKLKPKISTKADICSSAGTQADSELQPIVIPSASLLPNLLLCPVLLVVKSKSAPIVVPSVWLSVRDCVGLFGLCQSCKLMLLQQSFCFQYYLHCDKNGLW